MLTSRKSAILIWLVVGITLFVVPIPMSYGLKMQDGNFLREKRETFPAGTSDTILLKNNENQTSRSFSITSYIRYRYATTVVSHSISNPTGDAKEVFFTVTIPEVAFISGFLMQINDEVYEAFIEGKEDALRKYQEAVDRGETAGYVELSVRDSNIFTVSVNVEPHIDVTFKLTYEQLLVRKFGLYEHILNINPGQIVKSMSIEVNIEESSDISVFKMPCLRTSNETHSRNTKNKLKEFRNSGNRVKFTWSISVAEQIELSDSRGIRGQYVVSYDVARVSNQDQILLDGNYFVHFYAPTHLKALNKHVLFCLDISGSMEGRKIQQLQEALIQILNDIEENDFFTLVLFSSSVQRWTLNGSFIIPATPENIAEAKTFANTLVADGGTNIIAALRTSIRITQSGQEGLAKNSKPLIIFLTDGQPNEEMSNTEQIVQTVTQLNVHKYPIYCLALGEDADFEFLRKLSISNWGDAKHIYVASDTHLQLKNFHKEVSSTLLSNVNFEYTAGQIVENTLTKSAFTNLFNGSELIVAGRLANGVKMIDGNLTGQSSNGLFCTRMLRPIIVHDILPLASKSKGQLEEIWAYLYINELLNKDLIDSNKNSMHKQMAMNLSLQYSFVTPLTSLVVRKPNQVSIAEIHKANNPEMFTMDLSLLPPPPSSAPSTLLATSSVSVIFLPFLYSILFIF